MPRNSKRIHYAIKAKELQDEMNFIMYKSTCTSLFNYYSNPDASNEEITHDMAAFYESLVKDLTYGQTSLGERKAAALAAYHFCNTPSVGFSEGCYATKEEFVEAFNSTLDSTSTIYVMDDCGGENIIRAYNIYMFTYFIKSLDYHAVFTSTNELVEESIKIALETYHDEAPLLSMDEFCNTFVQASGVEETKTDNSWLGPAVALAGIGTLLGALMKKKEKAKEVEKQHEADVVEQKWR